MSTPNPRECLQLRSLLTREGVMQLSLASIPIPRPEPQEVVVRIEAAPINPSDLGLLLGAADWSTPQVGGTPQAPVVSAPVPAAALRSLAARIDHSLSVGNEGAGTVVEAGTSEQAQALLGKTVALLGGATYTQYRCVSTEQCLELPPGTSAREGASAFVNPLTALGMVTTLRNEGHKALINTAAASNLGQMLNRLCQKDGIELVSIVRNAGQESLLRQDGARYVLRSDADDFVQQLNEAVAATGATLAFDAIGGGNLADQILQAMEIALSRNAKIYSRYGSSTHKQVYIYGALDLSPTLLSRSYGLAWGVCGWLLTPFMQKIGGAAVQKLKERVAAEIKTTFASSYSAEISLHDALKPEMIAAYGRRATGEKFLINPQQDL